MNRPYVPDRGDLIWLEPDAKRAALVLSPKPYNEATGLALVCPVTGRIKGYPFETALPTGLIVSGVVLADHATTLDWRGGNTAFADRAPPALGADALAKLRTLL